MDLRNCSKCGRVFAYENSEVCSRCSSGDEDEFRKVKDYLYYNPGANIVEVSEETEVSEKKILQFLRESRIEVQEGGSFLLDCERCGVGIASGRFCESCTSKMQKEFSAVTRTEKPKEATKPREKTGSKMHIEGIRKKYK